LYAFVTKHQKIYWHIQKKSITVVKNSVFVWHHSVFKLNTDINYNENKHSCCTSVGMIIMRHYANSCQLPFQAWHSVLECGWLEPTVVNCTCQWRKSWVIWTHLSSLTPILGKVFLIFSVIKENLQVVLACMVMHFFITVLVMFPDLCWDMSTTMRYFRQDKFQKIN